MLPITPFDERRRELIDNLPLLWSMDIKESDMATLITGSWREALHIIRQYDLEISRTFFKNNLRKYYYSN